MRSAATAARSVACVPTMGALHAGHGALIDRARPMADLLVVTIFVNPIQFDRKDDYQAYTRDLDADVRFCDAREVDIVFAPSAEEMYPQPVETAIEVAEVAKHLCGAFRAGHFRGVATVVAKLFNIVQPDVACFGEKDLQQLAVIRQMVTDLNFPVRVEGVETVREPDGLALSSRNVRLNAEERRAAPVLYRALRAGRAERQAEQIKRAALHELATEPALRLEYLEVVDARMQPVTEVAGPTWLAAAAWLGSTRLIDNVRIFAAV